MKLLNFTEINFTLSEKKFYRNAFDENVMIKKNFEIALTQQEDIYFLAKIIFILEKNVYLMYVCPKWKNG